MTVKMVAMLPVMKMCVSQCSRSEGYEYKDEYGSRMASRHSSNGAHFKVLIILCDTFPPMSKQFSY